MMTDKDLDEIEAYYKPIEENALPGHEAGFRAIQVCLLVDILRELRGVSPKKESKPGLVLGKEKKK